MFQTQAFTIDVSDKVLSDLRYRIENMRWPEDPSNDDWSYGANGAYLREIAQYWLRDYDWRATERAINNWPNFKTTIDDIPIHYIHARGKGPAPMPLILNHGWPWTFWDLRKVVGPLSDPQAYGGDAADAFDVIIPSLPGYGFSGPLRTTGINYSRTSDLWVQLMTGLGYERFGTQGGDWGAFVSEQLGHKYADRIIGLHIHLFQPLTALAGIAVPEEDYFPEEADLITRNAKWHAEQSGYYQLQSTKPQTPAYALNDSPVGLLAWLVEKRRSWTDCSGDVESVYSKDDLIDNAMIYWVSESFGTAARYYYEARRHPWTPSHDRSPVVEAPTAILKYPNDVLMSPKRWAERYFNLQRWTELPNGGHFGAMEKPMELVEDLRAFFRPLREIARS